MTDTKPPEAIYLQCDEDGYTDDTTWCRDSINDQDIKYVRADLVKSLIEAADAVDTDWNVDSAKALREALKPFGDGNG